jgi:hypothetical protein
MPHDDNWITYRAESLSSINTLPNMWFTVLIFGLLGCVERVACQDLGWPQDENSARNGVIGFYNYTYEVPIAIPVI